MEAYLGSALRTPFGAFGGALKGFGLPDLAARLVPPLLDGTLPPERLLLASGLPFGPDPAGQTARLAGLGSVPALLIQRGEASGLWALKLGMEALATGQASRILVLAGATPSSSPFQLPNARWGTRFGEVELRDPLLDLPQTPFAAASPPALGIFPLPGSAGGKVLQVDEAVQADAPWRDGAAGFLLGRTPFPGRPRIRLDLHQGLAQCSGSAGHQAFPGGAGLPSLISAFHSQEASVCFSLEILEESWTIRVRRETP